MFFRILLVLTFVPFIELYFLIQLSDSIGWSQTIGVIFLTGFLGAWLLRQQGASIFNQLQETTRRNQLPSDALANGFLTFVGGVFLLTPGLLTDVLGLSLILPLTQPLWKSYAFKQWQDGVSTGRVQFYTSVQRPQGATQQNPFQRAPNQSPERGRDVIDIEATSSTTEKKN